MGMHFKLGLYEHQSAGAIQALIDALLAKPEMVRGSPSQIERIAIEIYEPAFGIIGDPAKRDPTTRQSADHSMVYILSAHLRKAFALGYDAISQIKTNTAMWQAIMLLPLDYDERALYDATTRELMAKIEFAHGGEAFDAQYPKGIPTKLDIANSAGAQSTSEMVMFPSGHARNTTADLKAILAHKWSRMADITNGAYAQGQGDAKAAEKLLAGLANLKDKSAAQMDALYNIPISVTQKYSL